METDENYPAQFKNVIEKIIDAELNKRGITKYISALVKGVNDNGTVNVCIPPNLDSIISGLLNKTGETLAAGDSVELCAKNGSVNNSWVSIKRKTDNSGDRGLPSGGTAGQVLAKKSINNYDVGWVDAIQSNQILWGPDYNYMVGNQTINLSQKVSEQKNGIVLMWQAYVDGKPQSYHFNYTFVPKYHTLVFPAGGVTCWLSDSSGDIIATKYVYVYDDKIQGNDINGLGSTTRSGSGIITNSAHWVLTYVLGV